jgi:hypothetical protein
VSYDGGVKLVDFGIAKATASHARTDSGSLKGKVAFMSPEQCQGKAALDRRSDIFSIGAILYELTTGSPMFAAESEFGILTQLVNEDAPPPSTRVKGYPPQLEAVVMMLLQRDRERRYPTAQVAQQAIDDCAYELRLRSSQLLLAKYMESLFASTFHDWSTAKERGAYFVEQHVVQTITGRATRALRDRGFEDDETNIRDLPFPGEATVKAPPPEAALVTEPMNPMFAPPPRQVRAHLRPAEPTPRKNVPLLAGIGILGGMLAASVVIYLIRSDDAPAPAAEPSATRIAAPPPAPTPIPAPTLNPAPPPPLPETAATKPEPAPAPAPAPVVSAAPAPAPPKAKPKAKAKPEKKTWNSDSPFMPVSKRR